ncbi:MAG TPA: MFS transporter, partial [Armatimonadota bacterium]|nr:MFS transporter [Armatimonadota bacterium]
MRRLNGIVWVFLLVEFIDELTYGANEAAWPLIRRDLGLSYTQIGLLLSIPNLFGSLVEPALGVLGDTRWRRTIVLTGGVVFAVTLAGVAGAWCFPVMLAALLLHYPASGGFVNLAQAELMDVAPDRRDQNMARWTAAGSLGVVVGPLILGGACLIG